MRFGQHPCWRGAARLQPLRWPVLPRRSHPRCRVLQEFGYGRPINTLAHDVLVSRAAGQCDASTRDHSGESQNALEALRADHVVVVFPGGDYDACRPTSSQNLIDFNGRTGYVRTAIEADVPIVPAVSIGGQENQLYLTRGDGLAKRLGPIAKAARLNTLPVALGLPFGFSLGGLLPPKHSAANKDRHAHP